MRLLHSFRLLGALVLLLGLISVPLFAQQPQDSQPQAAQSQPAESQQQPQTFMGKIVKSQGSFVLKDDASNAMYKLDNEDQAKQYVGKSVKVTGTLDPSTNTIHVTNIEVPAKS